MNMNSIPAAMNTTTGRCVVCNDYARDCDCWVCGDCARVWTGDTIRCTCDDGADD